MRRVIIKTTYQTNENAGMTLGELEEALEDFRRQGAEDADLVKVRSGFRAGVHRVWIHPAGKRYNPLRDAR